MTMALSAPLQRALFERLAAAPALSDLSGRIFDDAPHRNTDPGADPYVTLGDETVSPWNTASERGAAHDAVIRVYAQQRGFLRVKEIAAGIVEALSDSPPVLTRGRIVTHEFIRAETRREEGGALRRVDLTFRFVIEDDL